MKALFFDKEKWQVYNAIKWGAENAENPETKYVCDMLLQEGKPSTFGYMLTRLNDYYLEHLVKAIAQYMTHKDREQ